jgi:hypothetical protein
MIVTNRRIMTEKYDQETRVIMANAKEDLQKYMASAGRNTSESELLAWQQGYIAGVNRAMGVKL